MKSFNLKRNKKFKIENARVAVDAEQQSTKLEERSFIQVNAPYLTMIIKPMQVLLHFCIFSPEIK